MIAGDFNGLEQPDAAAFVNDGFNGSNHVHSVTWRRRMGNQKAVGKHFKTNKMEWRYHLSLRAVCTRSQISCDI